MADRHAEEYARSGGSLLYPPDDFLAVTPSDSTVLDSPCVCLYIGGAGDVSVTTLAGNVRVFKAVPVGTTLWGRFTKVMAATTATYILAGQ